MLHHRAPGTHLYVAGKVLLPLAVLGAAAAVAVVLLLTSSPVASRPAERMLRAVRTVPAEVRKVHLDVRSQGTVAPHAESDLIPEVSGPVVWTSPSLVSGGHFDQGEPLLRIDRADYEAALKRAAATLARAEGENDHAQRTLERQQNLQSRSVASDAELNEAERGARVAAAGVQEARVAVDQAERDLARTEIRAPYTGRIRTEQVDVGQFLTRGQPFAKAYATDFVEIRLPLADSQLAFLDLPFFEDPDDMRRDLPEVELTARFAGRDHSWKGRIVRTEGEIDAKSRLVNVVARVENDPADEQPPLPVGLFVQAQIRGRQADSVAVIPRQALRGNDQVLVVDDEDRLRLQRVEVLRVEGEDVYVSQGLASGDRITTSMIQAPVDGMRVRPVDDSLEPGERDT